MASSMTETALAADAVVGRGGMYVWMACGCEWRRKRRKGKKILEDSGGPGLGNATGKRKTKDKIDV